MCFDTIKLTYILQLFHKLYRINIYKCTHILNRYFINTIRNSNLFQPLKAIFSKYNWYILAEWVNKVYHQL
jgi:hypothetical protein